MFYPPTPTTRFLHEPPTVRAVYDNPPVISSSPRWQGARALAARLTRGRGRHDSDCLLEAAYRSSPIDAVARTD